MGLRNPKLSTINQSINQSINQENREKKFRGSIFCSLKQTYKHAKGLVFYCM